MMVDCPMDKCTMAEMECRLRQGDTETMDAWSNMIYAQNAANRSKYWKTFVQCCAKNPRGFARTMSILGPFYIGCSVAYGIHVHNVMCAQTARREARLQDKDDARFAGGYVRDIPDDACGYSSSGVSDVSSSDEDEPL